MSLNVCNDEGHFIIPLRELSTGKVHNVECVVDEGLFYTGYMPNFQIFFKDEWALMNAYETGHRRENTRLASTALIGGVFVLIAIVGCIVNALR